MIIIRYAEIALKGANRPMFERKLVENIRKAIGDYKIINLRNRILIDTDEKLDLSKIFGIASYSYTQELPIDLEILKTESMKLIKNPKSFRISCQRLDKSIKFTSIQIQQDIGEHVFENTELEVDLKNPELNIQIELFNKHSYLFTEKIPGPLGLPTGVEGKAILLIENKNSIEAALAVMKRGCDVIPVSLKEQNLEKLKEYGSNEELIIIKDLDEIDTIAEKKDINVLVVGQTLKDFKELDTKLLTLRPLIAK